MTSAAERISGRRVHDAEASRTALLAAARELFDSQGDERATTREIGERAGVDPALIARYFGGKEALFFAAISERSPDDDVDYEPRALLRYLLERWDTQGHGPISRSLASPGLDPEITQVSSLNTPTGISAESVYVNAEQRSEYPFKLQYNVDPAIYRSGLTQVLLYEDGVVLDARPGAGPAGRTHP